MPRSAILMSLRPHQWVKNLFLFAAIVFSGKLFALHELAMVAGGFILFCGGASAVYLANDVVDAPQDRLHPEKSKRPIAARLITPARAIVTSALLGALVLLGAFALRTEFGLTLSAYVLLNIAYSFWLKRIVILDVMTVAMSFVLRVIAGAVVINVPISDWLLVCTMLLALFLGFSKRRYELVALRDGAAGHRSVLQNYSPYFLDQMIAVVTASTVVAYSVYTVSPETPERLGTGHLIYTVPFVLYGIFRYLFLVHQQEKGGNPTRVFLNDIPLIVNVVLWMLTAVVIIYWRRQVP